MLVTSAQGPIRVLLVDPDCLDRQGLKCLLRNEPGIDIVGEADDARHAVDRANADPPDVMLVDSDALPPSEEAARWLSTLPPRTRLLLLCREDESERLDPFVEHGVMGVVFKRQTPDAVTKAITKVHGGEPWIARCTMARLLSSRARPAVQAGRQDGGFALLSGRERQIANLVAKGHKNRSIAELLAIREATVRNHLSSIFRKLHVAGRLELAVFAHRHGMPDAQPD